jgi:hypothetical protein
MQLGRAIVEQAIGEQMDGTPLETQDRATNPKAVAGRLGGQKGGNARARALSRSERRAIAKKAAAAPPNLLLEHFFDLSDLFLNVAGVLFGGAFGF